MLLRIARLAGNVWYAPLVALLAALDAYILVIPTDALLITGVLAAPKRWIHTAAWAIAGSALGAGTLTWLVSAYGDAVIAQWFPKLIGSPEWIDATRTIHDYGVWGLTFLSMSFLPQQPAVIAAGLAELSPWHTAFAVFVGRSIKYLSFGWAALHSPRLLARMTHPYWAFKKWLRRKDAGAVRDGAESGKPEFDERSDSGPHDSSDQTRRS